MGEPLPLIFYQREKVLSSEKSERERPLKLKLSRVTSRISPLSLRVYSLEARRKSPSLTVPVDEELSPSFRMISPERPPCRPRSARARPLLKPTIDRLPETRPAALPPKPPSKVPVETAPVDSDTSRTE